jgi:hypothetical protein
VHKGEEGSTESIVARATRGAFMPFAIAARGLAIHHWRFKVQTNRWFGLSKTTMVNCLKKGTPSKLRRDLLSNVASGCSQM